MSKSPNQTEISTTSSSKSDDSSLTKEKHFSFKVVLKGQPKSFKIITAFLIIVIIFILVGQHINLPYYALKPGGVFPANKLVQIKGYTNKLHGGIDIVYVYESQENLIEYPIDKLSSKISIYPEQDIVGTPTGNLTNSQADAQDTWYSQNSQISAEVAALKALHYKLERNGQGSLIGWVDPTSPAGKFITAGDTILQINNTKIKNSAELASVIESYSAGTKVTVTFKTPTNKIITRQTVLAKLFTNTSKYGYLGVGTMPNYKIPLNFQFQDTIGGSPIGGPSAGLAYCLTIIDEISGGNLLRGINIAATGTISTNGQIGPIGGLVQKTYAVVASGAQIFFVPDGQSSTTYKSIYQIAGSKLKIYKVSNLSQVFHDLNLNLN
jgi:PDZ domain-containing protein